MLAAGDGPFGQRNHATRVSYFSKPRDVASRQWGCLEETYRHGQGRAVGCACPDGFAPSDSARDIQLELI
jgi:hypothetical protein